MEQFIEKYYTERKNSNCLKWDKLEERFGDRNLLPLWVADMDFKVADAIQEAMRERIEHGVFGYSYISSDYQQAFFHWMKQYFNVELQSEWLRYTSGVVQALYHFVNAFTQLNDSVLILTPVYYPFHNAIKDTGRQLVEVKLVQENDRFVIDFDAFEQAIIDQNVKLFIHCSPHNPIGRVWTQKEQLKLIEICERHQVIMIADEIHQDFVFEPHQQQAILSFNNEYVRKNVIAVTSASKTFNLAGLTHSIIMIPSEILRKKYDDYLSKVGQTEINLMGAIATQAGYQYGREWLDNLSQVIFSNYHKIVERITKEAKEIRIFPLEGTYLVLLDLNPILKGRNCKTFIQDQAGLAIDFGEWFALGYEGYIRINLATSPQNIDQALEQIIQAI